MNSDQFENMGEFMAEVKNWIQEAAREGARESTELISAQLRLEMQVHQQEHEERTRVMFREELQREIKQYFGTLEPHEHIGHHAGYNRWLVFRNGLLAEFVRGMAVKLAWVLTIVFLTLTFVDEEGIVKKIITGTKVEKTQTKPPTTKDKVE